MTDLTISTGGLKQRHFASIMCTNWNTLYDKEKQAVLYLLTVMSNSKTLAPSEG